MKFRYLIIISLVISLFGWLGLGMSGQNRTQAQAPDELLATGKLEPDLLAKFEAAPIQKQPVIVMMAGQADLSLLNRQPNTLTRREIA